MKRCQIAAKSAGSIGILQCCVLNDFFTQGYERLPDLWGLFYPPYLVYGKFGPRVYIVLHISLLAKKKRLPKKKI